MLSIADFVGIPYALGGRSRDGADCWGLVRLVYAGLLGISLDDYEYSSLRDAGALIEAHRHEWLECTEPLRFAVVVLRNGHAPMHCGIVIDSERMLHTIEGGSSVVQRFTAPDFAPRIVGYYVYA